MIACYPVPHGIAHAPVRRDLTYNDSVNVEALSAILLSELVEWPMESKDEYGYHFLYSIPGEHYWSALPGRESGCAFGGVSLRSFVHRLDLLP